MSRIARFLPAGGKRFIHGLLWRMGYQLVPAGAADHFQLLRLRQSWLTKINADLVIDVGANIGQFVSGLRTAGYAGDIISFEPQRDAFEELNKALKNDSRWTGVRCALGAEEAELELQIAGNSMSSSLLPMLDSHEQALPESAVTGTETVPVHRLDSVLAERGIEPQSAFLKVDTQGFEAAVVEGASGVLDKVAMIELELSLVPLYGGQELLADSLARMQDKGFVPIALEHGFADATTDRVLQVDGLFVARRHL